MSTTEQALLCRYMSHGSEISKQYQKKTHALLKRTRAGTASQEEIALVSRAITRLTKQNKPRSNSAMERQLYALAVVYLTPEKITHRETSLAAGVHHSTIYRDIDEGVKLLAVQLFGADALDWK